MNFYSEIYEYQTFVVNFRHAVRRKRFAQSLFVVAADVYDGSHCVTYSRR